MQFRYLQCLIYEQKQDIRLVIGSSVDQELTRDS